jgi:ATP-dependent RNA helicase RhlE
LTRFDPPPPAEARRGKEKAISIMSESQPRPEAGFPQFALAPPIQRGIAALGFEEPRPIQAETIPAALEGRDILGLAQTGTGKTAAFALPILQRLHAQRRPGPRALILAPTRELAMQIHAEIGALARFTTVRAVTVFGGVSAAPQIRALRERPDVIVACPGRLLDLMQQGAAKLGDIEVLVLDEADHMFDIGFLPNVRRIVKALPRRRQNLLFSATMPAEVLKLTQEFLRDPTYVQVGRRGGPAQTISHAIQTVARGEKAEWLARWLRHDAEGPVLIFCRTKIGADRLASRLVGLGIRAAVVHADRSQQQRLAAVEGFRSGTYPVLVATDVAARGLDIDGIAHVVNYEVPDTPETYVHRVGRTGRAESTGRALTLVAPEEVRALRALEKAVGVQLQ